MVVAGRQQVDPAVRVAPDRVLEADAAGEHPLPAVRSAAAGALEPDRLHERRRQASCGGVVAWVGKDWRGGAGVLIGLVIAPAARSAIDLELVVDGLERPLFVGHAGDGSGRLFVSSRRAGSASWPTARCASGRF